MEPRSSISDDTTLKDACGHLCIRQRVAIPASPPRTWTRRKGLASTGSSIFATRLEIASAATVQTLRNLSGTPAPPWFHKMWFPNAAGRSQSFSFPETRIQDETFDGETISRPSPAFLASPRLGAQDCCASSVTTCIRESTCSRPVDGQELQIHPVPGFFGLADLLIEPTTPTLFFRLPEQDENQDRQLGKKAVVPLRVLPGRATVLGGGRESTTQAHQSMAWRR